MTLPTLPPVAAPAPATAPGAAPGAVPAPGPTIETVPVPAPAIPVTIEIERGADGRDMMLAGGIFVVGLVFVFLARHFWVRYLLDTKKRRPNKAESAGWFLALGLFMLLVLVVLWGFIGSWFSLPVAGGLFVGAMSAFGAAYVMQKK